MDNIDCLIMGVRRAGQAARLFLANDEIIDVTAIPTFKKNRDNFGKSSSKRQLIGYCELVTDRETVEDVVAFEVNNIKFSVTNYDNSTGGLPQLIGQAVSQKTIPAYEENEAINWQEEVA